MAGFLEEKSISNPPDPDPHSHYLDFLHRTVDVMKAAILYQIQDPSQSCPKVEVMGTPAPVSHKENQTCLVLPAPF